MEPGTYLVLDRGIWEDGRQKYPAGSPIPWAEAERLNLIEGETMESDGGGVIGAPPPSHAPPGRQTRPRPTGPRRPPRGDKGEKQKGE